MVIEAEHDVHESFSGDGLIVARFGPPPDGWLPVELSINRYGESLFRNPAYDLVRALTANPERANIERTVRAAYRTLLLRRVDENGLDYFADHIQKTGDVQSFLEALLHSAEFVAQIDPFLKTYLGPAAADGLEYVLPDGPLACSGFSFSLRQDGILGRAGDTLLVPKDDVVLPAVFSHAAWNADQIDFIASLIGSGEGYTLLDIGANIGLFSRQMLHRCSAIERCLCVEPDPTNHAALRFNLRPFEYRNVSYFPIGLGEADGTAPFYRDRRNIGNCSLNPDAMRERAFETTAVDVAATDAWMTKTLAGAGNIVWKSDTQGHDELIIARTPREILGSRPGRHDRAVADRQSRTSSRCVLRQD